MDRWSLFFTGPGEISVVREALPEPRAGQLLVAARCSGISSGTEMLLYRGQVPEDMALDASFEGLDGPAHYPTKYGYCLAGEVVDGDPALLAAWRGKHVFAFHPHESHFWAYPEELACLPVGIPFERATFFPNTETAINFLHDGQPMAGEQVVVIGQGVVGLLTTVLLAEFPLAGLVSFDRLAARRAASLAAGAQTSLDPMELPRAEAGGYFISHSQEYTGADLVYEISGSPSALNLAIDCAGYNARIVVGSWYGKKQASLELGGKFHRSHIRLISSQVSRIPPELSGQWTKQRRLDWAWQSLQRIQPEKWITHRFPIQNAAEAYQLLEKGDDRNPPLQVVLDYPD